LNPFTQLRILLSPLLLLGALTQAHPASAGDGLEIAGPEIWISGPDAVQLSGTAAHPDVAVDNMGRRIHVWTTYSPPPAAAEIALRRFDAEGTALEDPRIINSVSDLGQERPRVAVAADGSFLVVWQSIEDDNGIPRKWVRSQAFDSDGVTMGSEQLVSQMSTGQSTIVDLDVAALRGANGSSGGFVVTWDSVNTNGDDTNQNIQARMILPSGVPTGNQFQVNTSILGSQRNPAVTELQDGGFLVVWIYPRLQAQRYSAAGAPVGDEFEIETSTPFGADDPDVAIGWNGTVAVVWEDNDVAGDATEIRAKLLDEALNVLGADFRVNTVIVEAQIYARVADYGPKGFLVTWDSVGSSAGNDTDDSVQARIVTGVNTFDGEQVQLNVWETNDQEAAGAHGWYGRLAAAWRSVGNDQNTMSPFEIHITGRNIEHCLFCDDFEWYSPADSGNLWRWSNTAGSVP